MTSPRSPEDLFETLRALGIETRTIEHPPVYTVEEAKAHRGGLAGMHIKNLFLRNKKGAMWLVVAPEDHALDLKRVGERIGAGHVSFASAERLMTYLGVAPGSVTPFGVVNDAEGKVTVVLEAAVAASEMVNAHPLTNDKTTTIRTRDLLRFLEALAHPPLVVAL